MKAYFSPLFLRLKKDTNLFNQLSGAVSIIYNSANLLTMPKGKFRPIEGHNLNCKVYEAKKGSIRVYLFHQENTGRIIVMRWKKGQSKERHQINN
jgi:oxalate decarboxylase/phosphoglucose isomerase-like protein (cupin superfamily)